MISRRAHQIEDWSLQQLDEEGHAIKKEIEERSKVCLYRSSLNFG